MNAVARIADVESALTPLGAEMVGALGVQAQVAFGELTLIAERESIVSVLTTLRDRFGFQQLVDLCGVDFPDRAERFEVVYHLLSMTRNARVRVKLTQEFRQFDFQSPWEGADYPAPVLPGDEKGNG